MMMLLLMLLIEWLKFDHQIQEDHNLQKDSLMLG